MAEARIDELAWQAPAPILRAAGPRARVLHVVSGSARVDLLGTQLVLTEGETLLSGPGCRPAVDRSRADAVSVSFVCPAPCSSQPHFALRRIRDARVVDAAKVAEAGGGDAAGSFALEALGSAVHRAVHDAVAIVRPEIARAAALLRARFAERIPLETLSREVGLSKFHFVRLFRGEVGLPPHAYQLWIRVLKARALIEQGTDIVQAAMRCGFADQAHLTRCFRRFLGITPSDAQPGRAG